MTFTNRVLTITQDTIVPKVTDNFLSDNLATFRFISNGQKWSGTTLNIPVKIAKNPNGGSFSGLDPHLTNTADTRILLSYDVRGVYQSVSIPGLDKAINNVSESQVIGLVKTEIESSFDDMLDSVGTMFYADGSGNSNKDFIGLDALDDDGTSAANIGNQSRTAYPTLQGTRTGSGGTLTLLQISTLLSAIGGGSAAKQQATMLLSNETVWDLVEKLTITGVVRANYDSNGFPMITRTSRGVMSAAALKGSHGFISIVYRGIPVVKDEKCTSQTLWGLNENYIQWYGLNSPDLQGITLGQSIDGTYADDASQYTGVQWSGFKDAYSSFGEVAYLYLLGNLVTNQPRRQGRLTAITTA